MSVERMKMSKLMEHNNHQHTDQLYQPLRNVLTKSTMPYHLSSLSRAVTPQKVNHSRVTRNLKLLSSIEADKIRRTTFISADRQLVPTHHLEKVYGKHFYAVDVQQTEGQPLRESQFDHNTKFKLEQIVYEYKEDPPGQSLSQMKGQMFQSFHHDKDPGQNFTQQKTNMTIPHTQYSQLHKLPSEQEYSASPSTFPGDMVSYKSHFLPQSGGPTRVERNPQPLKVQQYPSTFSTYVPKHPRPSLKLETQPISNYPSRNVQKGLIKESPSEASLMRNSGVKSYTFDRKMRDSRNNNRSELIARKKDGYKYNLFSMLDEPGNTGCRTGCWVNNQLVASRRSGTQWN